MHSWEAIFDADYDLSDEQESVKDFIRTLLKSQQPIELKLPEKKELDSTDSDYTYGWCAGWNDCIDVTNSLNPKLKIRLNSSSGHIISS